MGIAAIALMVYALLEIISELLLKASLYVGHIILNDSITLFENENNIMQTFLSIFPFNTNLVGGIIDGLAYALFMFIFLTELLKSMSSPLTGADAPNPLQVAVRAVLAIIFKLALFGSSVFGTKGILNYLFIGFTSAIKAIGKQINWETSLEFNLDGLNPIAYVALLVISAALIGQVVAAATTYIERILTFVLSVIVGPIMIMLYVKKDTEQTAREWLVSIFVQLGAITLSLLLWSLFLEQMRQAFKGESDVLTDNNTEISVFNLAVAVAILALAKNTEKIFNNFGIRTMPNTDSVGMMLGGVGTAMMAGAIGSAAGHKTMDASRRALGVQGAGRGGMPGGLSKEASKRALSTGVSMFDKNGNPNMHSTKNKALGVVAHATNGGNLGATIGSAGKARALQMGAGDEMLGMAQNAEVGSAFSGINVAGQKLNASEAMNALNTGYKDGVSASSSMRFVEGEGGASWQSVKDINGHDVNGILCEGVKNTHSGTTDSAMYYTPMASNDSFRVGQEIEVGDQKYRFNGATESFCGNNKSYKLEKVSDSGFDADGWDMANAIEYATYHAVQGVIEKQSRGGK